MNLFLIGSRCTGKTSVGESLSRKIGWPFLDLDLTLVEEQGVTITDIVNHGGWGAFREMERALVQSICARDRYVVATGGGVVLDGNNVKDMKRSGILIWLKAAPETIRNRMLTDEGTETLRPSLTSEGFLEEIEDTLAKRNPLYENAMDFSILTDDYTVEEICNIIMEKLKKGNYFHV